MTYLCFGKTAGSQCAYNAMFSICWSLIRKVVCWTHRDLDHILNEETTFTSHWTKKASLALMIYQDRFIYFGMLSIKKWPKKLCMRGYHFKGNLFWRIYLHSHNSRGCLLFICSYVVAIFRYSTTRDTSYFLFHSHCRNSRGITDSPFGFSVLLQFANLIQVERYIEKPYNVANLAYRPYFQIQFISVNVDDSDLGAIQTCQVNLFVSVKRKERLQKISADVL